MIKAILDLNVASVLRRIEQGDCPTEPALSVETLENMVHDLSRALATQPATSQEGEGMRTLVAEMASREGPEPRFIERCRNALAATPTPPTLSEDLQVMREALEPFAAACNITTAEDSESLYESLAAEKLTWRDLRRARAALAQVKA